MLLWIKEALELGAVQGPPAPTGSPGPAPLPAMATVPGGSEHAWRFLFAARRRPAAAARTLHRSQPAGAMAGRHPCRGRGLGGGDLPRGARVERGDI